MVREPLLYLAVPAQADLKPSVGQCLNEAFRHLLGLLWIDRVFRMFFQAFANCRYNY